MDRMELIEVLKQLLLTRFVVNKHGTIILFINSGTGFIKTMFISISPWEKDGSGTMPSRDLRKSEEWGTMAGAASVYDTAIGEYSGYPEKADTLRNLQNNI